MLKLKMFEVMSTIMYRKVDKINATKTEVAYNVVFPKALKQKIWQWISSIYIMCV